jgi:MerR family transcriptional regulator, thiopeptide resistance regulator
VSGDAAMGLAERHRLLIDRWFYPCSVEAHRGLADLYEADDRFAAEIDSPLALWWECAVQRGP